MLLQTATTDTPILSSTLPLRPTELSKGLKGTILGYVCVVTEGNIEALTDLGNSVGPCTDSNPDLLESNNPVEVIDVNAIKLDSDPDSIISME